MIADARPLAPTRELVLPLRTLAALGGAVLLAGLFLAPLRALGGLLLVGWGLLGFGLAGAVFVAMQQASAAGWATLLRRVPEALTALVPVGWTLVALAVLVGGARLYPGMRPGAHLSPFQHFWLAPGFLATRWLLYGALWIGFSRALVRQSRCQDRGPDTRAFVTARRLSVVFLPLFGISYSLATVDVVGALEPRWYSTMLGVYHFAGLFSAGIAAIVVALAALRRAGRLPAIAPAHLHDLGKLLFAFTIFWAYIAFSQWMLIWYGNLPEEAVYYAARLRGGWVPLMILDALLNWGLPFLLLLSQPAKKNLAFLARVAGLVLVGRWLDLFLAIAPPLQGAAPQIGGWELGMALGGLALGALVVVRSLASRPLVAAGDPWLAESLAHH